MTDLSHPPTLEPTQDWLAARRAHLLHALETSAPAPRRRVWPTWRVAAVALAVLLLAGAAVAATGYTFFDWLHSETPGEARFSVDASRTVAWPAPEALACTEPGAGEFSCAPGRSGSWVYAFYNRVDPPEPAFTRENLLGAIESQERAGRLPAATADRLRAEIAAVGDEFFEKMSILFGIGNISQPHQVRPGVVLVPPKGVPQFATCEPAGADFRCTSLSAGVDIPIGAPIYGLRVNSKWVERPYEPQPPDVEAIVESVFGRPLTPAEQRLLITLETGATGGSEPSGGAEGGTSNGG
jgi:hypothetical protein